MPSNDLFVAILAPEFFDGQDGNDTVSYQNSTGPVKVDLLNNTAAGSFALGDTYSSIENITGSNFVGTGDKLYGDTAANILIGLAGNDILEGGEGADTLNGGDGLDYVSYSRSTAAVIINLSTNSYSGGDATGDALISIESIIGSSHNDILVGSFGNNELYGGDGDDTLEGKGGSDVFNGGAGFDYVLGAFNLTSPNVIDVEGIIGTAGADTLVGNAANNDLQGLGGNDTIEGGAGADIINGGDNIDTARYINSSAGVNINLATLAAFGGDATGDTLISIESAIGSKHGDMLTGNSGNNTLTGDDGADTINGGGGNDTVYGGSGIDTIITGSGTDTIEGGADADNINAGAGNDIIVGGHGADIINGGDDTDKVRYTNSSAAVNVNLTTGINTGGDAAGDNLSNIEIVIGSALGDTLRGNAGANTLQGGAGNDALYGDLGADILNGGTDWDYANYSFSASAIQINLATGIHTGGDAAGDTLIDIDAIVGSNHDDTLIGDSENNYMRGGAGNDYLNGGHGWDKLLGQQGDDTYVFTSGFYTLTEEGTGFDRVIFDSFWSPEDITLNGNVLGFKFSNNTITFNDISLFEAFSFDGYADKSLLDLKRIAGVNLTFVATLAPETFEGGNGNDTVDFSGSNAAVNIDLLNNTASGGFAEGDHFTSIENIKGSDNALFRDTLIGNASANILEGKNGHDFLEGGAGADVINGGAGWDYARYTGSSAGVNINLTTGVHTGGDALGDTLIDIEAIVGSSHDDTFKGGAAHDSFWGGGGSDTIYGGIGQDQLYGEGGADTFIFEAVTAFNQPDLLRDFKVSDGDSIDISDLLSGYDPLTMAITDFVRVTDNGTNSFLEIDTNGGANSFVQIATLLSVTGLTDEEALETSGRLITV